MAQSQIKITGFKELDRELKAMEKKMAQSYLSKAVAKSAEPLEAAAKTSAPVGKKTTTYKGQSFAPGRLRDSIHTVIKEFGGTTIADVKPKVPYAWLVEYGHKLVKVSKKTGKRTVVGFAAPKAYMRPAFESSVSRCAQILEQELTRILFS